MENVTNKNVGLNGSLYYILLSFVFKENVPDSDCCLSLACGLNTNGETRESLPCSMNCSMLCCSAVTTRVSAA